MAQATSPDVTSIAEPDTRRVRLPWFVGFLGRRLAWAVITLFIFLTFLYFFMQVWVPYTWEIQARTVGSGLELYGWAGLWQGYLQFMGGLVRGDLGQSLGGGEVSDVILAAMPVTLSVFIVGTLIAWVIGEFLGRVAAWRQWRLTGGLVSVVGVLSATIFPPFLVFILARWLRDPLLDLREALGLPVDSLDIWRGAVIGEEGVPTPSDVRWLLAIGLTVALVVALIVRGYAHRRRQPVVAALAVPVMLGALGVGLALSGVGAMAIDLLYRVDVTVATGRGSPGLALVGIALISFGQVMFMIRVGIEDERSEDYVLTARAKGLPERAVRDRHVARNALAPALAGSFLAFPTVLAGMIIVEFELEMTGLSSVLFNAIEFQNIPVIMGVMVVLGIVGVLFRIVTDITIAVLDPRQRRGAV